MSNVFEWDAQKYSVNVKEMDDEHQVLINIMNKLAQKNEIGASKTELKSILEDLLKKTKAHFHHEEQYFSSLPDYHSAAAHKKIHSTLIQRLEDYFNDFSKADGALSKDFFIFLKVWLSAHICGIDSKYGAIASHQHKAAI